MNFTMQKVQKHVNDARLLYKSLNGVFIIYKPSGMYFQNMRSTIISKLCKDLNNMYVRPPVQHVAILGSTDKDMKVIVHDSYADHPLVVGPRYQTNDFRLAATGIMHKDTCGVVVCGINYGNHFVHRIRDAKCTRFYRVKGLLGQATDNYFHTGKIVERSTYGRVKRGHIDKICSSMQSSHQRKMFELCGVDMQSQAAYELAVKGLLRPADPNSPMIYTIRCIDFSPPEFTLEIVSINENEMYLKTLIHDLGMQLHSTATCTQILCVQNGLFNIKHALLMKHWGIKGIVESMQMCERMINENPGLLHQESSTLVEAKDDSSV